MNYRKADINDLDLICEIRKKQLIDEGLEPSVNIDNELHDYFRKQFEDDSIVEWFALEEGEVIATAALLFLPFPPSYTNRLGIRAYVTNMYTAKDYRRKGIAGELLNILFDEAKSRGVHKIFLSASKMGKSVYLKAGFTETGNWLEKDI